MRVHISFFCVLQMLSVLSTENYKQTLKIMSKSEAVNIPETHNMISIYHFPLKRYQGILKKWLG